MTRAFTLIETVIAVGISAIALIALVNLFFLFNSLYGYQQAFIASSGSASTAMNALEAGILPAELVLTSYAISGTTYTTATSTLVLQLPAVDSSGNLLSSTKDYVVFFASSTNFYRRVLAGSQSVRTSGLTLLSSYLNSATFTLNTTDFSQATSVIADIRTQATYKQQVISNRLKEQMYLRNF